MQHPIRTKKTLSWAIIELILNAPNTKGSGNMRLQYLALFDIIAAAQERGVIVTTKYLEKITRIDRSGIFRATKALEDLRLLKREKILDSNGRGRAWRYIIDLPEDMHRALLEDFLMRGVDEKMARDN